MMKRSTAATTKYLSLQVIKATVGAGQRRR